VAETEASVVEIVGNRNQKEEQMLFFFYVYARFSQVYTSLAAVPAAI